MSEIAIDEVMRKLGLSYDEVKAVVDEVASADIKGMATKLDIAELKTDIVEIKTELKNIRWFMVLGFSLTIGALGFIIKLVGSLIIK